MELAKAVPIDENMPFHPLSTPVILYSSIVQNVYAYHIFIVGICNQRHELPIARIPLHRSPVSKFLDISETICHMM